MIFIGNHLASSKGFLAMGKAALKLGANTFAFFTRNPRGGKAKPMDTEDAANLMALLEKEGFGKLVAHAPYTMNLCSENEDTRNYSAEMLADDLQRMEYLPGNYYNFHPGSHVGQGVEVGVKQITEALNKTLFKGMKTTVLLETMAGKGSEIGRSFEELKKIIDGTQLSEYLGVCFDTCHVWDGGYDIVKHLDEVLEEFDKIIGIDRLKAVHLNDSMNPLNAHKDRHQKLGEGCIGIEAIKKVVCHPKLQNKPFILETPNDDLGYMKEIAFVKQTMHN